MAETHSTRLWADMKPMHEAILAHPFLTGHHAIVTSRYEWLFWDAGSRQETWPAAVGG